MAETQTLGNCRTSLKDVATMLLHIVQGMHIYPGGLYMTEGGLNKLQEIRRTAGGDFKAEAAAIEDALKDDPDVKLNPDDPEAHLFVDRLYCRQCHQRPCEDHLRDTYKPPAEVATLAS